MLRLIVLMLLLVPAAEACSFSKEPPAPGVFYVWDTQGQPTAVAVHSRGLGATCELSNVHAVGADRFAWVEKETIHVLDLETQDRSTVPWSGDHPQDLAVAGGDLLVRENTGTGQDRVHKIWSVADDGTRTLLHSTSEFGRLHGPFYVTEADGVGIVDVRTGAVVAQPQTAQERGFPGDGEPSFVGTDGRFLVYQEWLPGGARFHAHDLRDGSWVSAQTETLSVWQAVGGGRSYTQYDQNLTIIDLATGDRSLAMVPSIALLGAGGGHVVLGAYSADSVKGAWRAAFAEQAIPVPVWPVLVGLAIMLRRR